MKPIYLQEDNTSRRFLYLQLYDTIKARILQGEMVCGEKLPSLRSAAADLGISITTAELAYNQLLVEALFLPVQIRRTGEVDILRALAACQGQGGDFQSEAAKIRPDLDADNPHIIRAGKGHRLTFALITLMGSYSNTKPRERRFSLGVCTRTQRLIQSQDKSSFQPYQTADCMFCGGSPVRLAAFLSAQRQHRHKPCVYGYDCRHAALFPLCHV